jgi:hypothetical protein
MKTKCKRCEKLDGNCRIIDEYLPKLNREGFLQLVDSELYCYSFKGNKNNEPFTNDELDRIYKRFNNYTVVNI